ncbi:5-formyltetrahydrofolate cyclo-ligase [Thalassomonas sp. M1454]|nr:5-formyltetrahydrofolate cyclo-ligase [Thalassomonas sp. M1454]
MITHEQRQALRKQVRKCRQQLSINDQQQAAIDLCQQLIQQPSIINAQTISVYLANDGEISLEPFIQWCWQQNKKVYLPVIHPFSSGHLLFLHYQQTTTLVANKYNILEPKLAVTNVLPFNQLDVLIAPLVAFDAQGNRLGMGGGFYDRTLSSWHNQKILSEQVHLSPIGVAHDCQLLTAIPSQHWDIPLPQIITATKHYSW